MCIKKGLWASALCAVPGVVGFTAGVLSVIQPKLFIGALVCSLIGAGYVALRSYARTGKGERASEVEDVEVAAGALLSLSFLFSFWTGLAYIGGLGILNAGVVVALSTSLLAAFTLTFVRNVIARKVPWLETIVGKLLPVDGSVSVERGL